MNTSRLLLATLVVQSADALRQQYYSNANAVGNDMELDTASVATLVSKSRSNIQNNRMINPENPVEPETENALVSKSRSNIQNNRIKNTDTANTPTPQQIQATKSRSNI